jgi:hypothetical protein
MSEDKQEVGRSGDDPPSRDVSPEAEVDESREKASATDQTDRPSSTMSFDISAKRLGDVTGRDKNVHQVTNIFGTATTRVRPLTEDQFHRHTVTELKEISELHVERRAIDHWTQLLRDRRILLLKGRAELGKSTLAQCIARRLIEQEDRANALYVAPEYRYDTTVDFMTIARSQQFHCQVLLFRNVSENWHEDFEHFVKGIERSGVQAITRDLGKTDVFLILTAEANGVERLQDCSVIKELSEEVHPPTSEELDVFLRDQIKELDEALQERFSREYQGENAAIILECLATYPKAIKFVRGLKDLPPGQSILDFASWVEVPWLHRLRQENRAAWCSAMALTFCTPGADRPVSWFQVMRVAEAIMSYLHRQTRTHPERFVIPAISDDEVFASIPTKRVELVSDSTDEALVQRGIRFEKPGIAQAIWRYLLDSPEIVTRLQPMLSEHVKSDTDLVRITSLWALGRLGEIDPYAVVLEQIAEHIPENWEQVPIYAENLGYLLQGVTCSEDSNYRNLCLRSATAMLYSNDGKKVAVGAMSLRQVGRVDVGLVCDCLKMALMRRVGDVAKRLRASEKDLIDAIRVLTDDPRVQPRMDGANKTYLDLLLEIADDLGEPEQVLMYASRFSLVGLALDVEPIAVMRALLQWRVSYPALGPVIAMMLLLDENGFALSSNAPVNKVAIDAAEEVGSEDTLVNRLWLIHSDDKQQAAVDIAHLWTYMYQDYRAFPKTVQPLFETVFFDSVMAWADDAARSKAITETVCDTLLEFLREDDEWIDLERKRKLLSGLLSRLSERKFRDKSDGHRQFVSLIRKRRIATQSKR